jgi:hypothetical protein
MSNFLEMAVNVLNLRLQALQLNSYVGMKDTPVDAIDGSFMAS